MLRNRIAAGTLLVLAGTAGMALVGFSAGLHLLGVIGAVWWELLVPSLVPMALGWGILGEGRFGIRDPFVVWRAHPRTLRACTALLSAIATVGVVVRGSGASADSHSASWWLPAATLGAISTAVALRWWRRTGLDPDPTPLSRQPPGRMVVSLLLALAVASYLAVGVQGGDLYPFSSFPMYSGIKTDPHLLTFGKVRAHLADGGTRDLQSVIGSAAVRQWVADEPPERIETLAAQVVATWERRTSLDVRSFEVLEETWRVLPYPGPAEMEKVDEQVAVRVAQ